MEAEWSKNLNGKWNKKSYQCTDVTLAANYNQKVQAHKVILSLTDLEEGGILPILKMTTFGRTKQLKKQENREVDKSNEIETKPKEHEGKLWGCEEKNSDLERLDRFAFGLQKECNITKHLDGKHIGKAHQVILAASGTIVLFVENLSQQSDRPIWPVYLLVRAFSVPACRKNEIQAQPRGVGTSSVPARMKEGFEARTGVGTSGVPASRKEPWLVLLEILVFHPTGRW